MPITRTLSAITFTAAALALPMSAHASSPTGVDAVVNASAHAEVHVQQAQRLVGDASTSSQAKMRSLINRSRGELRTATAEAVRLAAKAGSSADVDAAVEAHTTVSTTLDQDAAALAEIALEARGRVQSKAAAALVADLRMQKRILDATMELVARAGTDAEKVVEAAVREQHNVTAEIDAAAQVAGAKVGAKAKSSADLAVGLGTQLIATTAQTTDKVKASVHETAISTLDNLKESLGDAAGRIHTTITSAGIGDDEVAVSGRGSVSLGTLARLGVNATVRVGLGIDIGNGTRASRLFAPLTRR
jgi:hypothetical protein